jgi:hypothetical protein
MLYIQDDREAAMSDHDDHCDGTKRLRVALASA